MMGYELGIYRWGYCDSCRGAFIEFTLSVLLDIIKKQENERSSERSTRKNERSLQEELKGVLKEAELKKVAPILDFLEEHGEITPQEAREATGKSETTVWRYLNMLRERGVVESTSSTNAATYHLKA
jgi:uncharacterized membrane protein